MTTSRTQNDTAPMLSQQPGIPADEWAKETEGAIESKLADVDKSDAATPGYELPGAFPMDSTPEASPTLLDFGGAAKQGVEGIYMTAHHGIEGVYSTAEQAARQYLPTSIVDKLEDVGVLRENPESHEKPSLPSQESESNFAPTHGGIGSLPGSKDEAGVATLPDEKNEDEENNVRGAKIEKDIGSHSSINQPSPLSATSSTPPPTMTEPPDSIPFPTDSSDSPRDQHTTANDGSNTNTSSQQPASEKATTNAFENLHSLISTISTPVSRSGTLTSPDSDAQCAARAGRDAAGMNEGTSSGSGPGGNSSTAAEDDVNGGRNVGTETQTEGNPPLVNLSHTKDTPTAKNSDRLCVNGSDGGGGTEDAVLGNEKKGHTRKSSFVQKLKGEAKALAEKVKTKTRG